MQQNKLFYTIGELASLLSTTVPAVQAHLARRNYEAVPPPIHLGKRLAWPVHGVSEWVEQKIAQSKFYAAVASASNDEMTLPRRKRGRPRKTTR